MTPLDDELLPRPGTTPDTEPTGPDLVQTTVVEVTPKAKRTADRKLTTRDALLIGVCLTVIAVTIIIVIGLNLDEKKQAINNQTQAALASKSDLNSLRAELETKFKKLDESVDTRLKGQKDINTVWYDQVSKNLHELNDVVNGQDKQPGLIAQVKQLKQSQTASLPAQPAIVVGAGGLNPPLISMADGSQLPGHPVQLTGTPIAANAIDPPAGLKARDEYSSPAQPQQATIQPQPAATQSSQTNTAQPAIIEPHIWPAQ